MTHKEQQKKICAKVDPMEYVRKRNGKEEFNSWCMTTGILNKRGQLSSIEDLKQFHSSFQVDSAPFRQSVELDRHHTEQTLEVIASQMTLKYPKCTINQYLHVTLGNLPLNGICPHLPAVACSSLPVAHMSKSVQSVH